MRARMNFQLRETWVIHFISDDCRRGISGFFPVRDLDALRGIAAKLHADLPELEADIRRWSRGTVAVELSAEQCGFFGIKFTDGYQ
jgi:hypothetical protein